ncbi:hypothetical protein CN138_09175 [Sinorhizobium meliloti]|uniref:hypothetical protein n=1 Tax=Rhizobium meliloti TaxID=382 RepID=UPI000FD1DCFD|nr:hypothetical protein [Sinorhizobium meliloti]RVL48489.1 hypothetical protein CN145_23300 [Sinorhizobium meliloti]RVL72422.1 hypothetical protein CN138_09175 [Sinorhizobium meliloti]
MAKVMDLEIGEFGNSERDASGESRPLPRSYGIANMRVVLSLALAAAGISFLLPSDGYRAALFIACAAGVFFVMKEPEEGPEDPEKEVEDAGYIYTEHRRTDHPFSRH